MLTSTAGIPAQATPTPAVTVGILVPTATPAVYTFPITLTGFTTSNQFIVTMTASSGTLNLPTRAGLTASTGYPALTASSSSHSFYGAYADIEAALRTVGFTASGLSNQIEINVQLTQYSGANFYYNPDNQHYYEYVNYSQVGAPAVTQTGEYSWNDANTHAQARTLYGLSGYLATITTEAENDFIKTKTSAQNVWIGAARKSTTWGDADGLIWEWATGPENGTAFSVQSQAVCTTPCVSPVSGAFNSWAAGEPNNYQYSQASAFRENYAVTNWAGSVGMWNDLPDLHINAGLEVPGFLVEYGGNGAFTALESSAQTVTSTFITFNINDGSGTPATDEQVLEESVSTALEANTFSRSNYVFDGWATSPSGAVVYQDRDMASITSPVTLYAVWSAAPVSTPTPTVASQASISDSSPLALTGSPTGQLILLSLFSLFAGLSLVSGYVARKQKASK